MTASFTEQMVTIYTHLGMLSRGKFSLPLIFFVTLTKVRVQLGRLRHEAGFRLSPE
jgi:hypothetical protein